MELESMNVMTHSKTGRPVNVENVKEAKRLYKKFKSYRKAGLEMGVDHQNVWRWVNNYDGRGNRIVADVVDK